MEKKHRILLYLLILVLALGLGICSAKISDLHTQLFSLQGELQQSHFSLQSEIQAIYDNVDAQLQAEASLLSSFSCEPGALDPEKHQVLLQFSLLPKRISEDMRLWLYLGGEKVECSRSGVEFRAELPMPLFREEELYPLLCIETPEATETEYLNGAGIYPHWRQYLPSLYAEDTSGRATLKDGTLSFDTEFIILPQYADSDEPFRFFRLEAERNGEVIWSKDITAQVQKASGGVCWLPFQESFPVSEGDTLIISVLAEDGLGYLHKQTAHYWHRDEGVSFEGIYPGEQIYDSRGALLYVGKE